MKFPPSFFVYNNFSPTLKFISFFDGAHEDKKKYTHAVPTLKFLLIFDEMRGGEQK